MRTWADSIIAKVCNEHRNSDLRADNPAIIAALNEAREKDLDDTILQAIQLGREAERAKKSDRAFADLTTLHPAADWTEADGPVFWWAMRNGEWIFREKATMYFDAQKNNGWHWSRIPKVELPAKKEAK